MARPRLSEDTRRQLLDEGVAAFLTGGYHGTGLKEVLDRINVPKGSFYNYFESKEAFGAAAIGHYAKCLGNKLAGALAREPEDPVAGLRLFFAQLTAEFEAANYVGGCLVANLGGELEGSELCRTALADAMHGWREGLREAIAAAQQRGQLRTDLDAGDMADLLVEAWEGAVIRMKIERSTAPLQRCLDRLLGDYFQPQTRRRRVTSGGPRP